MRSFQISSKAMFYSEQPSKWPHNLPEDIGADVVYTTSEPRFFFEYLRGYIVDIYQGTFRRGEECGTSKAVCVVSKIYKSTNSKNNKSMQMDFMFEVELFESLIYPIKTIKITNSIG